MSFILKSEEQELLKTLISQTCNLSRADPSFNAVEKVCLTELTTATSFFANPTDIERSINGLCDKFLYHGLIDQAGYLKTLSDKYLGEATSNFDLQNRLNVLQFLMCMSEKPTDKAIGFKPQVTDSAEPDISDWVSYLLPDEQKWTPDYDSDSSHWSDDSSVTIDEMGDVHSYVAEIDRLNVRIEQVHKVEGFENLAEHVNLDALQLVKKTNWSNRDSLRIIPNTPADELTVAIWEQAYSKHSILPLQPKLNIVPEYVIMREIIWQFFGLHCSTSFAHYYENNKIVPKSNVTVASSTPLTMCNFLRNFVPFIESFYQIKQFERLLQQAESSAPETYRSYLMGLNNLLLIMYKELVDTEQTIIDHNSFTLLKLDHRIQEKLKMAKIMMGIHKRVTLNWEENNNIICSTKMLSELHNCCLFSTTKLEQDLSFSLYLDSLYKYVIIIDGWLNDDVIRDYNQEFIISDENPRDDQLENMNRSCIANMEEDWQMNIVVHDLIEAVAQNKLLKTIYEDIFAVSKNVHFLRLLDRLDAKAAYRGTLYNELVHRILRKISAYFGNEDVYEELIKTDSETETEEEMNGSTINMYFNSSPEPEFYRLDQLVDTGDEYLHPLFADILGKKPTINKSAKLSTYQKLSELTNNLFPCQDLVHETLKEIVKERFEISGSLIKSILSHDYNLSEYMQIFQYIYLFKDDIIFPFYKHLFLEMSNSNTSENSWANEMALTIQMQDILFDIFGELSNNCAIKLRQNSEYCKDPLKSCNLITVHYKIDWPINIFVTKEHVEKYQEIFQFILKIKWALYALNELTVDYKFVWKKSRREKLSMFEGIKGWFFKVGIFGFRLINVFNSIQHYVLGYIIPSNMAKFDEEFRSANSFDSIKRAHVNFVDNTYNQCQKIWDAYSDSYGFNLLLYTVKKLSVWTRKVDSDEKLKLMDDSIRKCHENLQSVLNI